MPAFRHPCSVRLELIAKLHFHAPRFFRDIARIAERRLSGPMAAFLHYSPLVGKTTQMVSYPIDFIA